MTTPAYPFSLGKPPMRMGLAPISLRDWLKVGEEYERRTQLKQQLSKQQRNRVYAQTQDSLPEQREFAALVREFFLTISPQLLTHCLNFEEPNGMDHPLFDVALRLEEDVCLLREVDGEYCLTAASVCNPTWWNLNEKIGRPLSVIHQPIQGLEEKLGRMIAHFLAQLSAEDLFRRKNWFLTSIESLCVFPEVYLEKELFSHLDKNNIGQRLFIRTETQTFRRLSETEAVAFTIHVDLQPVSVLTKDLQAARGLLKTLDRLQSHERVQRRVDEYEPALRDYLSAAIGA